MKEKMTEIKKYRDYHEQNDINNTLKLRELTATLPSFCRDFFLGIKDTTSTRTRLSYAYDLRIFLNFCMKPIRYAERRIFRIYPSMFWI